MHEHPVAVGNRCDDSAGNVVLRCKNARCLEVPIIRLGPELRSRLRVDKLSRHPNAGAFLADASFQHVTRTEFGTEGALVSGLSLKSRRRGVRDDRQIPKTRKPGRNIFARPFANDSLSASLELLKGSTAIHSSSPPAATGGAVSPLLCRNFP